MAPTRGKPPRRTAKGRAGPKKPRALILRGEPAVGAAQAKPAMVSAERALAQVRASDSLEAAYAAWLELKTEHSAALARFASQRRKLDDQGDFLVGTVRAAGAVGPADPGPALARKRARGAAERGLEAFLHEAEARLAAARKELDDRAGQEEEAYAGALAQVKREIRGRVKRYLQHLRPQLRLFVRPAGSGRRIVHLERLGADDAVLMLHLLTDAIPSRYGFLGDDSTEDLALAPAPLYPDEGVPAAEVRPTAPRLRELVLSDRDVLPVKGILPMMVPRAGGELELYRLLARGPVLEAELEDGEGFRNLLLKEEAERLAGYLLRLQLQGRVTLQVEAE